MLIIVVLIILFVIFVRVFKWADTGGHKYDSEVGIISILAMVLIGAFIFVSIAMIPAIHITEKADKAELEARYEMLLYQYENKMYESDIEYGKRELMAEITEWNAEVAKGKELQRNIWVGVYYPNIYDDVEQIKISEVDNS